VWLSTEKGRKAYEELRNDALLLMDGRKKNAKGHDGADQWNAGELRNVARRLGKPIAAFGAIHKWDEEGLNPTRLDSDEFRGLAANMELCEGARILLTQNLWVEAGLMNGAMGTVRGFVWPQGGDPAATKKELSVPLCVVVEFDAVELTDSSGQPRTYFPGEPDKAKWVPIFAQDVSSSMDEKVRREQFPLVLAWAVTHWKAQGMTLRRARVRLGAKTAAMHGVGFVACTRVRHPSHMVFEEDLPEYEVFQSVRETPAFRRRRRFELRLEARASETIRKYGFCRAEGEQWSAEDRDRATALLARLKVVREKQRASMKQLARPTDEEAYLWEQEPDYGKLLDDAVEEVSGHTAAHVSAESERGALIVVAKRLRNELHLPAVKEALGALIPEDLHPALDDPKKRGKKKGAIAAERVSVDLRACGWRVSVFIEEALRECKPVAKDTVEFFLILARLVCRELKLPFCIGSVALGQRLVSSVSSQESFEELRGNVLGWASWRRSDVLGSELFLLPVPLHDSQQCREWLLLSLGSASDGEVLRGASSLSAEVFDRCGRTRTAARVASLLEGLIRGGAPRDSDGSLDVEPQGFPEEASSADTTLGVLGLIWAIIAREAGVPFHAPASAAFLPDFRASLAAAFAHLRVRANARGDGEVESEFTTREGCLEFLRLLGSLPQASSPPVVGSESRGARCLDGSEAEQSLLRALTWNIAGEDLPCTAPASWSVEDKMFALRAEIARHCPDVLALQEAAGFGASRAAPPEFDLVGVSASHCGFVQLYCRRGMGMQSVQLPRDVPAVAGRCVVIGVEVLFVAVHLAPQQTGEEARAEQLRRILAACPHKAVVVLGDFNVRKKEAEELCEEHGLRDMPYSGNSWAPKKNLFYENQREVRDFGACFDRIWCVGPLWAEGHMIGACRVYCAGKGFFLSDHFGLLGLVDVHAAYGTAGGGDSEVARRRRGALGNMRDESVMAEGFLTRDRERLGEQQRALLAERAAQRERGDVMRAAARLRKEREGRARAALEEVFGAGSLFAADGSGAPVPPAAEQVELEGFKTLPVVGDQEVWARSVRGGYPALNGLSCGTGTRTGMSYVVSLLQVLLRLPALSAWLSEHAQHCSEAQTAEQRAERCASCVLWRSRAAFEDRPGRRSLAQLVAHRSLAGSRFGRGAENDVVEFLEGLLAEMARIELAAARAKIWPDMGDAGRSWCTQLDRLFAHVCEERSRCAGCGRVDVKFTRSLVLAVAAPLEADRVVGVTDLYIESCRRRPSNRTLLCCGDCRVEGENAAQRRVVTTPNTLLVRVRGAEPDGSVRRYAVEAEERLRLPGLDPLELVGAIFHEGKTLEGGHYTCASLGPDGNFWFFNDERPPFRPGLAGLRERRREVYLLVYARQSKHGAYERLAALAGGGGAAGGSESVGATHVGGGVAAGGAVGEVAEPAEGDEGGVSQAVRRILSSLAPRSQSSSGRAEVGSAAAAAPEKLVDPESWAAFVASCEWSYCDLCGQKRRHKEPIEEWPAGKKQGIAAVQLRCPGVCLTVPKEPVVRDATAAGSAEKARELARGGEVVGDDVVMEGCGGDERGEGVLEQDRPLARLFEKYPQLRRVRDLGVRLEAWLEDPERARVYAENAVRDGWPDLETEESGAGRLRAVAFERTRIGRALARGCGFGGLAPSEEELRARRERAAAAAEQRAEAARQLTMKQLRAGKSTQAGRIAVAALRANAAAAALKSSKAAAHSSPDAFAALRKEFGSDRVDRVLCRFREQAVLEQTGAGAMPDYEVLASVLVAECAGDLDVAVASALAEEVEDVDRTRWGQMLASLPSSVVEGILAVLGSEYGDRARKVLAEPWSRDWEQWEDLVKNMRRLGVRKTDANALGREDVLEEVRGRVRAHVRLADQNKAVVAPSDAATLAELKFLGYDHGRGEVFEDSQCLADSLLQLLQKAGVLSGDISWPDREEACAENRRRLIAHADPAVRPRNRCVARGIDLGEDPGAYLQHDVHAEPTVWLFLERFGAQGKVLRELPAGGIRLTVFSRFDSAIGGRPVVQICERDVPEAPAGMLRMSLYNLTGTRSTGFHYDPLFASGNVVELED
jgi:ATP-dependent DNA helicase PIF1